MLLDTLDTECLVLAAYGVDKVVIVDSDGSGFTADIGKVCMSAKVEDDGSMIVRENMQRTPQQSRRPASRYSRFYAILFLKRIYFQVVYSPWKVTVFLTGSTSLASAS